MATVGRLSLKVAHEVRNPIAAIELNAELVGDLVKERGGPTWRRRRRSSRPFASRSMRWTRITEEYLAFARFPRPAVR